jgi:membrane associated rhomboid family serine protease
MAPRRPEPAVLILPLHRPLNAATFPVVTALLILVNVLVYVGFQWDDDARRDEAAHYYLDQGLAEVEGPAYEAWRGSHPDAPKLEALPEDVPPQVAVLMNVQQDEAFLDDLRADRVITPDDDAYADWRPLRTRFDALWGESFTDQHLMRFSEISPRRMFAAMFLHGDLGHLIGNMVFLAFLGLLVEGALGRGQYLALYLAGGLGAQLVSLAYRWGDSGAALGASGAIAALMGAFCVLWGTRRVRFFYWFFVFFDYTRKPALWLLPAWLGWELLNLFFNAQARVGFDAHAGGLMSGALLAFVVVRLGREKREFLDTDEDAVKEAVERDEEQFQQALAHLARLETGPAARLLAPLASKQDASFPVRLAWFRCCRYDGAVGDVHAAMLRVLQANPPANQRFERARALGEYLKASDGRAGFAAAAGVALVRAWIDGGNVEEADVLLPALADPDGTQGVPEACVALARRLHELRDPARSARLCALVRERWPGSPAADKAAFLQSAETT